MGSVTPLVGVITASLALVGSGALNEDAKLVPSDGASSDAFGTVAVSGVTAVVGARWDDERGVNSNSGSAYVFTRLGASWGEQVKLTALDAGFGDLFGSSVSISGSNALVGAPGHSGTFASSGAAYVFGRTGTTWSQLERLVASDAAAFQSFGSAVALSGNTAIVGAQDDDSGAGAAYVFVDNGLGWTQQAKIEAAGGSAGEQFGGSVSIDGDTAIIGALRDDISGAAYTFVRQGTSWSEQQVIHASDVTTSESFGNAVAISGDTAIVGASNKGDFGVNSGAAYVFVKSGTNWVQQQRLSPSDAASQQRFGSSVSVSGDRAVIGASSEGSGSGPGAAYLFVRDGGTWTETAKYVASDGAGNDGLGAHVAISGETILAGAPGDDDNGPSSGSVYTFSPPGAPPGFCDASDGSLAACPCNNPGAPETGCDIVQTTGGVGLTLAAQETAPDNGVTWIGSGFPPQSAPAALVLRSTTLTSGPVVFGDGLLCVGIPVVRLAATAASGGASTHTHGHGAMAGSGEFYYQLWFRNSPVMFCDPIAPWNMSNGRTLIW